jgi:capsular exopolysaccharide synthesis family protein
MDEFTANVSKGMSSLEAIKTDDGINPRRLASRYAELLRSDLLDYQRSQEALNKQIVKEMEAASVLVQTELQQRRYYRELERAESAYDVVLDRIGQLDLLSNYAGFANMVLKPAEPGSKVWPKVPLLVFAGGLLGSLLGVCWGLAFEVFDRSYRSPADVEDTLSVPVLGHLPAIRRHKKLASSDVDPTVCALHRPNSVESEAIRKLRGSLFYKTNHVDRPIIQITSPGQGEGKSTTAMNLAVSTAQSRRRVLLVDCDFRSHRSTNLLGEEFNVGLADVLTGKARMDEAIHSTSVPGLSIVPCGSATAHSAEWFTTEEFRQFIQQVSEEFDFVFIDSPAVIDFSDSMAIADAADFVIMTLGLSPCARSKSQEALAQLQSHGCTVLGVVVNEFGKSAPYANGRLLRRVELASH